MTRRRLATVCAALLLVACSEPRGVSMHDASAPPVLLSDWGLVFARGGELVISDESVPYTLNTPLFSDYALKLRSVWLPEAAAAHYRDEGVMEFPVGTIISKTFHYRKAPVQDDGTLAVMKRGGETVPDADGRIDLEAIALIETRLLVRYADGWRAWPYVWNEVQSDAYLAVAGDIRAVQLVGESGSEMINYVVPDANQCAGCHVPDHSSRALAPIGPQAWQLNRAYAWWGDDGSQLSHWAAAGLLTGVPQAPPAGVRWDDAVSFSPAQRARAYLDANCAHCHNADGAADTSALRLNLDAPVDRRYGLCKPPVAVGTGSGGRPYDIYPGRPDRSILLYRMQHTDPAIAMPELGRAAIHSDAVELLDEWIAGMNGEC